MVGGGLLLADAALAQPQPAAPTHLHPEAGRPFITAFPPATYDASEQNWAAVEDERGVLYVGNSGGLLTYDGHQWDLLQMPNRLDVRSLARDAAGRIWVGGVGDLGYLAPDSVGRMTFISMRDALPEDARDFTDVWETLASPDGVYFTTSDLLFRWDGERMQTWPAASGYHVGAVVQGTFYIRQPGRGLMRMVRTVAGDPTSDMLQLVPGGERFAQVRAYALLPLAEGRMLVGTREDGLFTYDGERFARLETEADALLARGGLYQPGAVLSGGHLALGTIAEGVVVLDQAGRLVRHIHQEDGLPDNTVYVPYEDHAGNLWLGLDNGIARVAIHAPFTYFDAQNGLEAPAVTLARHEGRLYAGTPAGVRYLDTTAGRFRPVTGLNSQVFGLLPVGKDLLIAGHGEGIYQIVGDAAQPVQASLAGAYTDVMSLQLWDAARGTVLVELLDGLAVLQQRGGAWVDLGRVPGTDLDLWSLTDVEEDRLWVSTFSGEVLRLQLPALAADGSGFVGVAEVTRYGPEDGLPEGSVRVQRLNGAVYVAGLGEAVRRFDEATDRFVDEDGFAAARSGHALAGFGLQEDDAGNVWIANAYGAPTLARPQPRGGYAFTPLLGLRSYRVLDVFPESDGVVWLLGDRLIRYDTRQAQAAPKEVQPLIRHVTLAGETRYGGFGPPLETTVAYGSGALRVAYALPGATTPPRFRTRLDGFDEDWSAWTTDTERSYTNLPPGSYRFQVASEMGAAPVTYALRVRPPWYRTPWGYLLYGLVVLGLVAALVRSRTHALERRQRQLEQTIAERTAALRQSLTDLQATQQQLIHAEKMASLGALTAGIAHEIKNPLNFINNFAEVNEELADELREDLAGHPEALAQIDDLLIDLKNNATVIAQHGKRADGIVRSMMQHARSGSSEKQAVDLNALVAEHVELAYHGKRATTPDFTIEIVRDFGGDVGEVSMVPQDLGRVVLNLVGNAFDALVEAGTEAPRVTVSTRRLADAVEIRVADNGPGMSAEVQQKIFEPFFTTKPAGSGTGLGLSLSYDIITQGHGGTMGVESTPGQGAAFVVTLPASNTT